MTDFFKPKVKKARQEEYIPIDQSDIEEADCFLSGDECLDLRITAPADETDCISSERAIDIPVVSQIEDISVEASPDPICIGRVTRSRSSKVVQDEHVDETFFMASKERKALKALARKERKALEEIERKEQVQQLYIEKTIRMRREVQESSRLSNEMHQGKTLNPFFNARQKSMLLDKGPVALLQTPWPTAEQSNVGFLYDAQPFRLKKPLKAAVALEELKGQSLGLKIPSYRRSSKAERTVEPVSYEAMVESLVGKFGRCELEKSSQFQLLKTLQRPLKPDGKLWSDQLQVELVGIEHRRLVKMVVSWLRNSRRKSRFEDEEKKNKFMLVGGGGKALICQLAAKLANFHTLKVTSNQKRNQKEIVNLVHNLDSRTVLLVEDCDFVAQEDRHFWLSLLNVQTPILFTCTLNPFNCNNSQLVNMHEFLRNTEIVHLNAISPNLIDLNCTVIAALFGYDVVPTSHQSLSASIQNLQFLCSSTCLPTDSWVKLPPFVDESTAEQETGLGIVELESADYLEEEHFGACTILNQTRSTLFPYTMIEPLTLQFGPFDYQSIVTTDYQESLAIYSTFAPYNLHTIPRTVSMEDIPFLALICRFDNKSVDGATKRQSRRNRHLRTLSDEHHSHLAVNYLKY